MTWVTWNICEEFSILIKCGELGRNFRFNVCFVGIYFLIDDTQTQSLYNYKYRTYIGNKLSCKSVSHENVQRLSKHKIIFMLKILEKLVFFQR